MLILWSNIENILNAFFVKVLDKCIPEPMDLLSAAVIGNENKIKSQTLMEQTSLLIHFWLTQ